VPTGNKSNSYSKTSTSGNKGNSYQKAAKSPAPSPETSPHPTSSNSGYYGAAPMDLSAGKHITPEEKASRMAEGRCLYCGGLGHLVKDCPNKKKMNASGAVLQEEQEAGAEGSGGESSAESLDEEGKD
jgi:hypothetical protein